MAAAPPPPDPHLDEVARLQRRWSVVREINKQILHATGEHELFTDACRIAVELGLFRFAWVGLISCDGEHVEPSARWGHEAGYLDGIRIDVAATPHGQGPTGTAVREGRPWISNDIAADPRFEPWRAAALERGYRCCAAFDCIVCDVMMPDLSGVEVYEALRRDGRSMERRVVFMTGGAVTASARAALARVPNRVLDKPLDLQVLRSAVTALVEEAAPSLPRLVAGV